ncbi:MAG: ester cyclase [Pseudonocardia sp.]|nr:ester cyclase [Pseudonocardia sp.]
MTPAMQVLIRDIERAWDGFCAALYERRDVDAAMVALDDPVTLVHMPSMTGGNDRAEVRAHLADEVVGHLPADLTRTRVSRTVDTRRLVDEVRWSFTHDRELPWLLPGLAPTGRTAAVLAISVVHVRQGRIGTVRTLWDDVRLRRGLLS